MTGEGELWNGVGAEQTSRKGELDSFTQIMSKTQRTSVTGCRGVTFVGGEVKGEVKMVEGRRENTQ